MAEYEQIKEQNAFRDLYLSTVMTLGKGITPASDYAMKSTNPLYKPILQEKFRMGPKTDLEPKDPRRRIGPNPTNYTRGMDSSCYGCRR